MNPGLLGFGRNNGLMRTQEERSSTRGVEEIKIEAVLVRSAGGAPPTNRQQLMGRRVMCEPEPGDVR